MKLQSSAFRHNGTIPAKYTCDGDDVNPPLSIADVPVGTQCLALIVDDPDAPSGTWVHWVVWNIRSDFVEISERSLPAGAVEGMTSFGKSEYGGPCPPSGTHRYIFKLFALDMALDLPTSTNATLLEAAMQGHILDRAELTGLYSR